jgi:DNA-binding winged helix-turn-helix (wHTH) protein/tetratricopeptide (TPR) repeat protein
MDDFRLGDRLVQPRLGRIVGPGTPPVRVRAKVMDLLLFFADHPGDVLSKDALLNGVWGTEAVSESALTRSIAELRQALGDHAEEPTLIETIPKRGYRLVAPIAPAHVDVPALPLGPPAMQRRAVVLRRGVTFAVLTILVAAAALASRRMAVSAPPMESRPWVLIAAFDNATRDNTLDGIGEQALERELANSAFLNVVPRQRIEDTLLLMREPSDAVVSAQLAREIAQRDSEIAIVITGRLDPVARGYSVTATLANASNGQAFASVSEQATSAETLLTAIRRLSIRVRDALGERRIATNANVLQRDVTTPSLAALKLYSESYQLGIRNQWAPAVDLARRAIAADPAFASAHIWLAWTLNRTLAEDASIRGAAERARALADTVTDWERYWILGSYWHLLDSDESAIAMYEALVRLRPDHYWGTSNLLGLYAKAGRAQEGLEYARRLAQLRPNDVGANQQAAEFALTVTADPEAAQPFFMRVRALTENTQNDSFHARASLFPSQARWLKGDLRGASAEVDRVAGEMTAEPLPRRDWFVKHLSLSYLQLGQMARAQTMARMLSVPSERQLQLALVAYIAGDQRSFAEFMRTADSPTDGPLIAWFLSRARFLEASKSRIAILAGTIAAPTVDTLRGELALQEGRTGDAIQHLRVGVDAIWGLRYATGPMYRATESLAEALEREHDLTGAISALERLAPDRAGAYPFGAWWMRSQARLAELYLRVGRYDDARAIVEDLDGLLVLADPDFPLVSRVRRVREAL